MRLALATLTLALATVGLAYAQNDVVELKNGDRISGTIQQMDGEFLVIDTPYTEKLKIDWKQVVAVTTETPYVVRIKPDKYVNARLVRQGDGMTLESEDLRSARPIMADEIATIGIPPGAQWDGIIGASIGGTSGNYPHNFNVGGLGEVVRRTDDDRLRIGLAGEHGETQDQTKVLNGMGEQIGVETNSRITTARTSAAEPSTTTSSTSTGGSAASAGSSTTASRTSTCARSSAPGRATASSTPRRSTSPCTSAAPT